MTTAADLVAETKRHLLSFQREPLNKLATGTTDSAGTFVFAYDITQIQAGAYLQIGLELVYVWSVDPGGKTAQVERAQLGSTATAHSAGDVVTINPKFPDFAILKALNDDLADLSSPMNGLFAVRATDLTASSNAGSYDLTGASDLLEVISVRHSVPGGQNTWATISNYELSQSAGSDFASGYSLMLSEGVLSGRPLRVLYKASFSPLAALTDDVELVTGLPDYMHSIPPLGAAMALVAPREVKRNFTEAQGEPRRGNEVPPGAVQSSMRGLAALRQQRIASAASRLAQQYPDRGFIPAQQDWF